MSIAPNAITLSVEPLPFQREMEAANLPIWLESLVGVDWLLLRLAPVYYGLGVPRGDGAGVILVPGFLSNDCYLTELSLWLRRIGYRSYLSRIGWNADCIQVLSEKLESTAEHALKQTGRRVHLVGHSLGGVLSRSLAVQRPDLIASVTTLGSPFRGMRSHRYVMRAADRVRRKIYIKLGAAANRQCYTSVCDCASVAALQQNFPSVVKETAIYTETDGIVDWHYCRTGDTTKDVKVSGTHIGLAFNHQVYRCLANRLADK